MRRRPEQQLHISVAQYLKWAMPDDVWWSSINPASSKSPIVAAMSKAMGLRAGAPDIIVIDKGHALFIELKAKDGRQSPAQRESSGLAARAAVLTLICRSIEEVESALTGFGIRLRARAA